MWVRADNVGYADPKVSPAAFLGVTWAFTAFSFFLLPARLYARWTTLSRLFWDDYLVIFAWTISLAMSIAVTVLNSATYEVMAIGAGKMKFPPNVRTSTLQFSRLFNIVPILLCVGLWSVKLAFLLFFRRLGIRTLRSLHRWWWAVFCTSLLAFLICFTTLPYKCCFTTFEVIASSKCQTQGWSFISLKVNCALDVFTDCLITSIPFLILRNTRISTRQKVALSIIFSLVIVTMIFAIVRVALTTTGVSRQIDPTWMYMWSSVELNIAIVIACIAPYRSFFLRAHAAPPDVHTAQRVPIKGGTSDAFAGSNTRIAPWTEEAGNTKWYGATDMEMPTIGVLPDASGSWSEMAPDVLWKADEESTTDVYELGHVRSEEIGVTSRGSTR
ncbi:hypothetical protein BU23DRAFT_155798 [Bimuria novae-zelandiae CBS 107.79]|uniref:Rhodopsin domain-containing protein n=1 Tax=Bimuria novae-zelandiae CBS 107.79 TaxID=1447943 RepID=A0A6A5V621_9PLEO|nr:hypothetical protein BU23DRAFT_155798 [Bimuria novae-zelandiae CBS 107.79]